MKYKSTRGAVNGLSFIDTVMMGLASDGGLMVPESWPQFSPADIQAMSQLSYKVGTSLPSLSPPFTLEK
jgi:threonine synthase